MEGSRASDALSPGSAPYSLPHVEAMERPCGGERKPPICPAGRVRGGSSAATLSHQTELVPGGGLGRSLKEGRPGVDQEADAPSALEGPRATEPPIRPGSWPLAADRERPSGIGDTRGRLQGASQSYVKLWLRRISYSLPNCPPSYAAENRIRPPRPFAAVEGRFRDERK